MSYGLIINNVSVLDISKDEVEDRIENDTYRMAKLIEEIMIHSFTPLPTTLKYNEYEEYRFNKSKNVHEIIEELITTYHQRSLLEIARDNPEDVEEK